MNIKTLLILVIAFGALLSGIVAYGGHYLTQKANSFVTSMVNEIVAQEADILVAVTRNDLISGNIKFAKSILEKSLSKSGISQITIVSNNNIVHETVGSVDSDQILLTIERPILFNSEDSKNIWGTYSFIVSSSHLKFLTKEMRAFRRNTIIPVFTLIFILIIGFVIYFTRTTLFLPDFISKDNLLIDVSFSERLFWGNLVDNLVAAKKKLMDAISEKNRLSQAASFATLSAQLAHDIRSPLSTLNIISSKASSEQKEVMGFVVERINNIANRLLENSKNYKLESVPFTAAVDHFGQDRIDVIELIKQIVAEKKIEFQERPEINFVLDFEIETETEIVVSGPAEEMLRMFSNLINNSVESFRSGPGNITLAVRKYGDKVSIRIMDDGCGIPNEILMKLGVKGITTRAGKTGSGHGLGVSHAKSFVEELGGSFSVVSKVGQGTIIEIQLKILNPSVFT